MGILGEYFCRFVRIWDFFSFLYPALKTWKCMISRWCPGYLNYWLFSPEIRHLPPDFSDKKVEISKHDQIDPTSTIKILTKKQKWKNKNFKYVAYMHCFKDHINNRKYFLHFIRLLLPPKSLILPNLGGHPYRYIRGTCTRYRCTVPVYIHTYMCTCTCTVVLYVCMYLLVP